MPKGYQDSGSVPVAVPVGLPCYGHQPVDFSSPVKYSRGRRGAL